MCIKATFIFTERPLQSIHSFTIFATSVFILSSIKQNHILKNAFTANNTINKTPSQISLP